MFRAQADTIATTKSQRPPGPGSVAPATVVVWSGIAARIGLLQKALEANGELKRYPRTIMKFILSNPASGARFVKTP